MVAGRSPEPRSVTVSKTSGSAAITGAAGTFNEEDAGRPIVGTAIPASATLLSVTSDTAATLSANATATSSNAATIGAAQEASTGSYGFIGWSPETDAESESYSVAANNANVVPPDRLVNSNTAVSQRSRG